MGTLLAIDQPLLSDLWTCPTCNANLDLWWTINTDLCWLPFGEDPLEMFEDQMTEVLDDEMTPDTIYNDLDIFCMCCDKPYHVCLNFNFDDVGTTSRPIVNEKAIQEDGPEEYVRNNGLRWDEIYEENLPSGCHTCKFYRDPACVPVRNIVRMHHATGKIPFFELSYCKFYDEDPDAINAIEDTLLEARMNLRGQPISTWYDV